MAVVDRFEEFCALRAQFSNEGEQLDEEENDEKPKFMTVFFADVQQVQDALAEGRSGTRKIEHVRFDALQSVTKEQEDALSARLDTILFATNKSLTFAKTKIDQMKSEEEKDKVPPREMTIRNNMYAALLRKFSDVVREFHEQEELYRKQVAQKTQRQLQLAFPDKSESEITQMVEDGQDTLMATRQRMGGTHASVLDALSRIQDKYKDVRRLEKSMQDLNRMYIDMAKLVDHQGAMLNSIAHAVTQTQDHVESGHKELASAKKSQKKKRKLMCLSTVCVVIIACVLFGTLFPWS
eukprot:GEMP01045853.1.p1 GENE.GEMP01045853.1~~GEMP01045853.1.p1  ORF type:complete len:295 (+),score=54.61 GEMP01045853.1:144-1028(+)